MVKVSYRNESYCLQVLGKTCNSVRVMNGA